ncbi:MAG: hypothetical protein KJ065_04915 [Anaerolineae bacterium]|nr:hypothetical protein [Anaerolineae bacterium]
MTQSLSFAALDELRDLEITLDGERLFAAERETPAQRIACAIICHGTRIVGLALLVIAAVMILREQILDAFYTGIFGLTLLIGGLMGLRQYQNDPRRLVLDATRLAYSDPWNDIYRAFPRSACLEVYCERDGERCALHVTHPDHRADILIEGLPLDIGQQIASRINHRLQLAPSSALLIPTAG